MAAFLDIKKEQQREIEMLFLMFSTRGRCELILIKASLFMLLCFYYLFKFPLAALWDFIRLFTVAVSVSSCFITLCFVQS